MKVNLVLLFISLLMAPATKAQGNKNYKDYRVMIGNKWFDADSAIDTRDLQAINQIVFQSKKDPAHKVVVAKCSWTISTNTNAIGQKIATKGGFDFKTKNLVAESPGKETLDDVKPGNILMLDNIVITGNEKDFPAFFRLYFR